MRHHARLWRAGELVSENFGLGEIHELLADPDQLVWFDLCAPSAAQIAELAAELKFSAQSVEDTLAPLERPKAIWRDRHLFVQAYATRLADADGFDSRVRATRISAFVVSNGLITVRADDEFSADELIELWDGNPELVSYGVGGLLHGLLDLICDGHDEVTALLDDAVEGLEDLLFADQPQTQQVSRQAYQLRRELVEIRRLTLPMRDVVNVVIRHGHDMAWHERLRYYYDDLYDHAMRQAEWSESLRDLVTSIFETNLSLNDMRLNQVMKKLSAWAAIIAVPTLITGWFGMNVPYLGFSQPLGLWLAAGLTITTVVGLYIAFRRYDWL